MTRQEIIELAQYGVDYSYWWGHGCWRTDDQEYGSCVGGCPNCTHSGDFGADCSGYVSKAWQVPEPRPVEEDEHPYSTRHFRYELIHWVQIQREDALPGDAFVYRNSGNTGGHIVLFESGDAWGTIWAYEAKGCAYGIIHSTRSLSSSYVGIRRNALEGSTSDNGTLQGVVYVDRGQGTADMSERIPGALVDCTDVGSTITREGDAQWIFSLPPGSYTVTASAAGYETNSRTCDVVTGQTAWCSIGLFAACVPQCGQQECGQDPNCGESCGTCAANHTCDGSGTCIDNCSPDCVDRVCGLDPNCGHSCGTCDPGETCSADGTCVSACQKECSKRQCGLDKKCGLSCGKCPKGETCQEYQCVATEQGGCGCGSLPTSAGWLGLVGACLLYVWSRRRQPSHHGHQNGNRYRTQ